MPAPPDATEYILGELTRRLNEVASRLEVGMTRMDGVFVRKDIYDQWRDGLRLEIDTVRKDIITAAATLKASDEIVINRIDALEESKQWLYRAIGGAFLAAVASAIVAAISVFGK